MTTRMKTSFTLWVVGLAVISLGILFPLICDLVTPSPDSLWLVFRTIRDQLPIVSVLLGPALVIIGGLELIFHEKTRGMLRTFTTLCSVFCSAFASFCTVGIFIFLSCFLDSSPKMHPVAFPVSIIIICLSLLAFLVTAYFYGLARRNQPSFKGIAIDFCAATLLFPGFFFAESFIINVINRIL